MSMSLIAIWGVLNLFLSVFSVQKIRRNKGKCNFIYLWGFVIGAFVWEDMLVLGILHAVIAFISVALNNSILWLVGFLAFWVVRSAGETLYFFLQQFVVPSHHPHNITAHFTVLRRLFGGISDQKCFIILQVSMQAVLTLSLFSLVYILKNFGL